MKRKSVLKNNKGINQLVSFAGILIISGVLLGVLIDSVLLFNSMIKINNVAELLSKQIQLSGTVDDATKSAMNASLEKSRITEYTATIIIEKPGGKESVTVTENSVTAKSIQLQTQYTVIVQGKTKFALFERTIGGKSVGISEVYSK